MNVYDNLGVRPAITPESSEFWNATATGELIVEYCRQCELHIFPPRSVCRRCQTRSLEWKTIEPPGIIYSYTVNHHPWIPDLNDSYAIALVEFPKYSNVRFLGRLVGFDGEPSIGDLVDFSCESAFGDLHRPYFTPWLES